MTRLNPQVLPLLIAIVGFILLVPQRGFAQESWPEPNYLNKSSVIDLEAGYFTALRGDFRAIYGSDIGFAIAFEHRESVRWGWRLRSEFERLAGQDSNLTYWHISAVPIITYTVDEATTMRHMVGAGVGVDVRTILVDYQFRYADWQVREIKTLSQTRVEPVAMAYFGIDLRPDPAVSLGFHMYFDHHFMGDTSRGAFGDTGGLHLMGSLGFWL